MGSFHLAEHPNRVIFVDVSESTFGRDVRARHRSDAGPNGAGDGRHRRCGGQGGQLPREPSGAA